MNETRVIYATMTKHSEKLAMAVAQALNTKAENIKGNPVLKGVKLLFVVGGIYGGESMPELLEFAKRIDGQEVKNAALITSCASKKFEQTSLRRLLSGKGVEVAGETICQGSFLFKGMGHPNKSDVADVVCFAKGVAEKVG